MFDKMGWEWYCSLFPKKKHGKIDPRLNRCDCGYEFHFSKIQELLMFLKGEYVHTCPQCLQRKRYRFVYHIVRDVTDEKDLKW